MPDNFYIYRSYSTCVMTTASLNYDSALRNELVLVCWFQAVVFYEHV